MKTVEMTDETYAALQNLAAARGLSLDDLLATLVRKSGPLPDSDRLLLFLAGEDFRKRTEPTERYLALLAWCATNHSSDFGDFISHQESGHHYLTLSRDEIQEVLAHNHARQIDGTQFWAVMTISSRAKARFVRRLLEFVGCRDEAVSEACRALGLGGGDFIRPSLRGAA